MKKLLHDIVNSAKIKEMLTSNRWFVQLYFNYLYRKSDPYRVDSTAEANKFEHAFSLLGDRHFEKGVEIGCGEGRNTWRVAEICDKVRALDISDAAIRRAKKNNLLPNVEFATFDLVTESLRPAFDYIFCSEMLYYLHLNQLDPAIRQLVSATKPGGIIHLLHSRSLKDDDSGLELKEFGAKTIHERFLNRDTLNLIADEQTKSYRITILQRG
jgi:2-polyprenyl-3-methyl-5-hydroxy-6-metoxy-1,4-benzoquinol methylase